MPSFDDVLQLTANGVVSGSTYAALGVGFALIYGVSKRFHFAYGLTFAIAGYTAAQAGARGIDSFWIALVFGAAVAGLIGATIERYLYRPLAARAEGDPLLMIFVASLGVLIVGENLIRLIWLETPTQQVLGADLQAVTLGSVNLTVLKIEVVVVSWLLIAAVGLLLSRTRIGRSIRAVRLNPELSLAVGINSGFVYVVVFGVGSIIAGVEGVFAGAQTAVTPDMGFQPMLFAVAVAFVGGTESSPLRIALAGLALGLLQSLSGLWFSAQWATPLVFAVVVFYAAMQPFELSASIPRARRARARA